jgi:hypothetical protein
MLHLEHYMLPLTDNLSSALRQIRHSSEPHHMWIDAICINQASPEEKSHQVRQMFRIYSRAARVLIWLGEGDDLSDWAMDSIRQMGDDAHIRDMLGGLQRGLLNRDWWKRVWTFQEAVAANDQSLILCGDRWMSWKYLVSKIQELDRRILSLEEMICIKQLARILHKHQQRKRVTFEEVFWATTIRQASESRDYVYALLGPGDFLDSGQLEPDYGQPSLWVYQKAMVQIFESTKNLDFLLYKIGQNFTTTLSWCLDFSRKTHLKGYRSTIRKSFVDNRASNFTKCKIIKHDIDSGTIELTGFLVGTVATRDTIPPVHSDGEPYRDLLLRHLRGSMMTDMVEAFSANCERAWAKRLSPGEVREKIVKGDVWKAFKTASTPYFPQDHTPEAMYNGDNMWYYDPPMLPEWSKTCYITTDTGYIGASLRCVQIGDIVTILLGCRIPLVLRPGLLGTHKILGMAYIDDVMAGQYLRPDAGHKQTSFVIN